MLWKRLIGTLKKQLYRNIFFKSVLTLTSGTIAGQLVTILASPVITRLYTPVDMGILANCMAIVSILGTIAAGRYELGIVLPEEEEDATALAVLGCFISICVGIVVILCFMVWGDRLVTVLKLQKVSKLWIYSLGFIITLIGLDAILSRIAIRGKKFKILAFTQVAQQVGVNIIKIGGGFLGLEVSGLFTATIIGRIVRISRLLWNERWRFFQKHNIERIKNVAIRYKKFPTVTIWATLLNGASEQIPILLFGGLFSAEIVGYYSLSYSILHLPMNLIGNSVGNVFTERAARERNNIYEMKRIVIGIYKKLLLLGSMGLSFITFYGDIIFPFVFGSNWKEAGLFAQWMSIWLLIQFTLSPLTVILMILEKQGENLFWNIILFLSRISVLFFPIFGMRDAVDIIILYTLCNIFFILSIPCEFLL
jgi:O-antigen/teichoic acid export membrane protein